MVHVMAACIGAPFRVVLEKLYVKPVEATGGLDVKGALADLLDGTDPRQRQEEPEMIEKVSIRTCDRLAGRKVLCLQISAIGCENEFCLGLRGCRAGLKRSQRLRNLSGFADLQVDVIGLEHTILVGFG